jgi:Domain of unknown function (DUF4397)
MFRLLKALPLALGLAALIVFGVFAASCGSSNSQARFVNAIQDSGGLDIDINGTKYFTDIEFPAVSASTYINVPSGSDMIEGFQTGGTTSAFPSQTVTLNSGSQYTLVATGLLTTSVDLLNPIDNNTAPQEGNVEFRVINASPSSPTDGVDVYIEQTPFTGNLGSQNGNPPQISALAYGAVSSYLTLPWNSNSEGWTIIVTSAGSTTPYNGFDFSTGNFGGQTTESIRTVVLTDVANGSTMSTTPIVLTDLN